LRVEARDLVVGGAVGERGLRLDFGREEPLEALREEIFEKE
jgi:hypothetical protein